ncbi:MAG: prepilin-type N-terminal cleavage/methylation domain-containing protein [Tissierellia bacterium]|nr:prepilin-type N-terminal cleavage/methylation domain-containing protein [Tissierellia bacterium]
MLKDAKGATLIEMLLVISIVSILITIPILNWGVVTNYIEKKEINEFINDITSARNRAILESKLYSVDILVDKDTYAIYNYNPNKKLVKVKKLNGNLSIRRTTIKNNEVTFGALGVPMETGTIYLTNHKGREIRITITPITAKVNIYMD